MRSRCFMNGHDIFLLSLPGLVT